MISSNDLKPGMTIQQDGEIFVVLEQSQNKTARSAMVVKAKVRNLRTGSNVELSWGGGDKITPAHIEKKEMQYLYDTDDALVFMDNETYEQLPLNRELVEDAMQYVKENTSVDVKFFKGQAFSVEAPNFVELAITQTDPGIKGDTATGGTKPATLETGAVVNVPLFVNEGDVIRVDTRSGEYMSRV